MRGGIDICLNIFCLSIRYLREILWWWFDMYFSKIRIGGISLRVNGIEVILNYGVN